MRSTIESQTLQTSQASRTPWLAGGDRTVLAGDGPAIQSAAKSRSGVVKGTPWEFQALLYWIQCNEIWPITGLFVKKEFTWPSTQATPNHSARNGGENYQIALPDRIRQTQITVEGADYLYEEIRIDNTLADENGNQVQLKPGAEVQVTVEAGPEAVVPKPTTP